MKTRAETIKEAFDFGTPNQELTTEVLALFRPVEGYNAVYYGQIRNGKTYSATADILELLQRGERVVANWKVDFKGFDQRSSFRVAVLKFLTGQRDFYRFDADNFEYIAPKALLDDDMIAIKYLNRLVNAHIFIDEGQWLFNSQERMPDPVKLELILHGGHYCRSLNIITQRPQNVFKTMRSQIQIWYKCSKKLSWPWLVFQRESFQMMKDDLPDEEIPDGRPKVYFADKRVLAAYDTHAMRADDADDRLVGFTRYETTFLDRIRILLGLVMPTSFASVGRWIIAAPKKEAGTTHSVVPAISAVSGNNKSIRQISVQSVRTEPRK